DRARARHRRTDANAGYRYPCAARGRRFEPRLVAAPMFDQPVHQIARAGMRDVLHLRTDIDHGVALQHAELEIIEIDKLHRMSPPHIMPSLCLGAARISTADSP